MQEEAAHPAKKRSVDGGSRTSQKGPLALPIVRDGRIRVVQEREHHDPVVRQLRARGMSGMWSVQIIVQSYQVGNKVDAHEVYEADGGGEVC